MWPRSSRRRFAPIFGALAATLIACGGTTASNRDGAIADASVGSDIAPKTDGSAPSADGPSDAIGDAVSDAQAVKTIDGWVIALSPTLLNVLSLDTAGILTKRSVVSVPSLVRHFVVSADNRFVYALGSTILAFSLDATTGALGPINEVVTTLVNPSGVTIDPSGHWLIVSDRALGVFVFSVLPDGSVGAQVGTPMGGPFPTAGTFDPSGQFVFVPFCDADTIVRYVLDPATGALTPGTPEIRLTVGSFPNHVAFHPTGLSAYAFNIGNQTITSFNYTSTSGALEAPEDVAYLRSGQPGTSAGFCHIHHFALHPSGKFAYATLPEVGGLVAVMSVAPSGRLTVVDHQYYFLFRGADPLVVDPTGTFLLVGNDSGGTQSFRIDPADGKLTFTATSLSSVFGLRFVQNKKTQ